MAGSAALSAGLSSNLGGTAGGGGAGGAVTVTNAGAIDVKGALSYGVFAQSIGGGGGAGGVAITGSLSASGPILQTLGAQGGAGGAGGAVSVTNSGSITVESPGSVGVLAQSIGGGGGAAGFAGAINASGASLTAALGGAGGAGGAVSVTNTGSINTLGDGSVAVLAQSIAGGGGESAYAVSAQTGLFSSVLASLGGLSSGAAGAQGNVTLNLSGGSFTTSGALSYGVLAQSIGAGGGNFSLSVPDPLTVGAGGVTLQLGATGGMTGDGAQVSLTNANTISTLGAGAAGLSAQSIGGGGGTEGVTGDVNFGAGVGVWSVNTGGSGASGGAGQAVTLNNSATLTTVGDNAFGLMTQSIGGGGGDGAMSVGVASGSARGISLVVGGAQAGSNSGGAIDIATSTGAVGTSGQLATGVLVQSIGGGGGVANVSTTNGVTVGANGVSLSAGATGGGGGDGGAITLNQAGMVATSGAGAGGVLVQSIGGGGGLAAFSGGVQSNQISQARLGGAAVGSGGAINLALTGDVSTSGAGAIGVTVQSIGGGGGFIEGLNTTVGGPVSLGSIGAGGGNGGAVSVVSGGTIATSGAGAHGLVVQSIGGGGGIFMAQGASGTAPVAAVQQTAGGAGGAGGAVNVTVNGAIFTSGAGADAIIVQSIGSGGGLVGGVAYQGVAAAAQSAGALNTETVSVQGGAGSGSGPINVTIGNVQVVGGQGGHALTILGGSSGTVTSAGTLATTDGVDGVVIVSQGGGDVTIVNSGLIEGSIDLGAGGGSLTNVAGGVFIAGPVVNLGPNGVFTNNGLLSPGGLGAVLSLSQTGSLITTPSSLYDVDLQFSNQSADLVTVGSKASLAGTVGVNVLNPGQALPGVHDVTIVTAGGGAANQGVNLSAPQSAVATFGLTFPDANDEVLHYVIDFAPAGLTPNETALGQTVNSIQTARLYPGFAGVAALLYAQPDVASLSRLYDLIGGQGVTAVQTATLSAIDGIEGVMGTQTRLNQFDPFCGPGFAGRTRLWAAGLGGAERLDGAAPGQERVMDRLSGFAAGWDFKPTDNVVLGASVAASPGSFSVNALDTRGKVETLAFGVYGAVFQGPWTGRLDFIYGHHHDSYVRALAAPGVGETESAVFNSASYSGRAEIARRFYVGPGSIEPFAAVDVRNLALPGFQETSAAAGGGAGALGLAILPERAVEVRTYLGAEAGATLPITPDISIRPVLRAAWVHGFAAQRAVTTAFESAPGFDTQQLGPAGLKDAARVDLRADLDTPSYQVQFHAGSTLAARESSLDAGVTVRVRW